MAEDDYGLKIPVPDEHTRDHDFYALVRDALNRIAALLSAPAPSPVDLSPLARRVKALEDAPAPSATPVPVDLSPLERRIQALEDAPAPAPVDLSAHQAALDDVRLALAELEFRLQHPESELR